MKMFVSDTNHRLPVFYLDAELHVSHRARWAVGLLSCSPEPMRPDSASGSSFPLPSGGAMKGRGERTWVRGGCSQVRKVL